MSRVLVVAPHPDDETLGCGGTLLRHGAAGDELHWLIMTAMTRETGFTESQIADREEEIARVASHFGFSAVHSLGFPATLLDSLPLADIVTAVSEVFETTKPEYVYLPHPGDAHSDHKAAFDACVPSTKWFRQPSVKGVYCYETLSETEFGLSPDSPSFRPARFVDISGYIDGKIEALKLYANETGEFPFPRSEEAVRAQAAIRGARAGFAAAEAFMVLQEIVPAGP